MKFIAMLNNYKINLPLKSIVDFPYFFRKIRIAAFLPLYIIAGFFLFTTAVKAASLELIYEDQAFTAPVNLRTAAIDDRSYLPLDWQTLTAVHNYSFETSGFYDPSRPMTVKFNYDDKNQDLKQIFAFDWASRRWLPLPTQDYPDQGYATAPTKATRDRLVLMSRPGVMSVGQASWYRFKNGLFAASPDFARGSVLRVYNLDNGRFVDVTINDFGPDRRIHPDRVIDLDHVAFSKIASPSAGLARVKIEPIKIVGSLPRHSSATVSSAPAAVANLLAPNISAAGAVIMKEADGKMLWGKNESGVAPLASLTKLVAVKVFLDTKPDLKKVVVYKEQDEKYNHEHVSPWESARLRVKDGDTLTVEDLLYSTLIGSANNTAESLVRISGLERSQFIARMNELVKSWGAAQTKFIEPSGLAPENMSSPLDYAIIAKEVLADPLIAKISTTARYSFQTINSKSTHNLTNTSRLVQSSDLQITGSKTGYLDEAGYCLVTRINTPQGGLIVVNFGSPSRNGSFDDNLALLKYGQEVLKNSF